MMIFTHFIVKIDRKLAIKSTQIELVEVYADFITFSSLDISKFYS